MTTLDYGDTAAREVSKRVAKPVASTTVLAAVPARSRTHGQLCVTLDTFTLWVFDANDSATAGSSTVIVPGAGAGRWKKLVAVA